MRTSVLGALLATLAAGTARADPYPSSPLLPGLALDWSSYTRLAVGADNWATTWGGDRKLYASFGDGVGLTGRPRQSLGFARLTGSSAQAVGGVDLPTGVLRSGKSYGVLAIGRTLYTFVSPGSGAANYREARLYRAPLGTSAWQGADWAFTSGGPEHVILPAFIQAGPGYAGGGSYVYAYAPRYAPRGRGLSIQAGTGTNGITLMRAPTGGLMDRDSWQYFAGLAGGRPRWSDDPAALRTAMQDRAGVGWSVSAVYDRALHRYLIMTEHGRSFASRLTLLEAPRPWGPFRTVAYTTVRDPQGRGQPRAFYFNILPNSFSRDGQRFTLAFTGVGDGDALNLVDGSFPLAGKAPVPAAMSRVRTRTGPTTPTMSRARPPTVPPPAAVRRSALKASARRGAAAFASGLASAQSRTA